MRYATERLAKVIARLSTTPSLIYFNNPDGQEAADLKQLFLTEIGSMKLYLHRMSVPIDNVESFTLLVHQYQVLITRWMDEIYAVLVDNVKTEESVLFLAILELRAYLEDIQDRYSDFFNYNARVPRVYLDENIRTIKRRYSKLARKLLKENITHKCAEVVLSPLKDFINQRPSKHTSFRRLQYLNKYEEELLKFKNNEAYFYKDRALIETMFFMNYNSVRMVDFMIERMKEDLALAKNNVKYLRKLQLYLNEVNKMNTQSLCFNENAKSLQDQISHWIREDINYHKMPATIIQDKAQTNLTSESIKKVEINIPIQVLSLIIRASKDESLIRNTNKTEVYHNVAKFFRTKNRPAISGKSLFNKSYSPNPEIKEIAIDILRKMKKRINNY